MKRNKKRKKKHNLGSFRRRKKDTEANEINKELEEEIDMALGGKEKGRGEE